MKTVRPDFFDRFKCTAQNCTDNCCIGWEIDIDDDTLLKYKALTSPFAEKLNESYTVSPDAGTCFKLCENDRCIHLNGNNLCEIIINLGEDCLCEICREHPRFYEFLPDRTECGLGLCCEEACRLLLEKERFALVTEGEDDLNGDETETAVSKKLFEERNRIFDIVFNKNLSVYEKKSAVRKQAAKLDKTLFGSVSPVSQILCDGKLIEIMKATEAIDDKWPKLVDEIEKNIRLIHKSEKAFDEVCTKMNYNCIFAYLIYRHFIKAFDDCEALAHTDFCINFMRFIKLCDIAQFCKTGKEPTLSMRIKTIKYLSKQIEYSEENTDLLTFTKDFLFRKDELR